MDLTFYHHPISPPSRSVLMTLKALKLGFETKIVNLYSGEQTKPAYKKINPRGKIPALTDGPTNIYESRAIACYLCNKYASGERQSLYPSDPDQRAKVDMMLYISEWVFNQVMEYLNVGGVLFRGEKTKEDSLPQVKEAFVFLDKALVDHKFIAGDEVTIADLFAVTAVLFLDGALYKHYDSYSKLSLWMERMEKLPYFNDCNAYGMKQFIENYQGKISSRKLTAF